MGAIVLALAAAVTVPMLLESDPKPLGEDVSIQIPPIDEGKFVNSVSPKAPDAKPLVDGKSAPSVDPSSVAEKPATARRSIGDAERRVLGQSTQPATPAGKPAAPEVPPTALASEGTAEKGANKAEHLSTEARKADADGFVIQVAALADAAAARQLVGKVKGAGFPGYVEPMTTGQGTIQRVRVGPYASRDAADNALAKLKAAGYVGMVAPAK